MHIFKHLALIHYFYAVIVKYFSIFVQQYVVTAVILGMNVTKADKQTDQHNSPCYVEDRKGIK